jgi:hypothetical protein
MGHCIHHPDRQTRYICQKHNVYLCEECLTCKDPKIYCKFRSACPIHFLDRENKGQKNSTVQDKSCITH